MNNTTSQFDIGIGVSFGHGCHPVGSLDEMKLGIDISSFGARHAAPQITLRNKIKNKQKMAQPPQAV